MGAAVSNNIAKATSDVANSIDNSTSVNSSQLNDTSSTVNLWHCSIEVQKDFNITGAQEVYLKNDQITKVSSQSTLSNKVQQSVLQNAISQIGSLGIGFAEAINNTSLFCSISNNVINNVSQSSTQFNKQANTFDCTESTIKVGGNFNINFSNTSDFFNKQVMDNSNITNITNDISQSITQKASATVQGLAGFLIALAVLIAAVGYAIAKPLTTGPFKILIVVIILIVLAGIAIWMYLKSAPPFFNKDTTCSPNTSLNNKDCSDCINQVMKTVSVSGPPLKYMFALSSDYSNPSGVAAGVSLFDMVICAVGGLNANNSGYTIYTMNTIEDSIIDLYKLLDKSISQRMPNLLINPSTNFITIPDQYLFSNGGGTNSLSGTCTPGKITYDPTQKTPTDPTTWGVTCPSIANWNIPLTIDPKFAVANSNLEAWSDWLKGVDPSFARFALIYILNQHMSAQIDLNVYQDDNELVKYKNPDTKQYTIDIGKNVAEYCQYFQSDSGISYYNGISGSGTITTMMGVCNDTSYKFHQFSTKIGIWIVLALVMMVILFFVYQHVKNQKK